VTDVLERVKTYRQFIGGKFVDAADGRTAEVINPANDKVIANVPASSAEDVDRAVNAAEAAFADWRKTTPQDRSLMLLKVADAIEAKAEELGRLESANAGKPVGAAIDEMAVCADLFRFFAGACRVMDGLAANEFAAGHTSIIRRDPIGVVASIAPWQHGGPQAVGTDAADGPGLRRDPGRHPARRRRQRAIGRRWRDRGRAGRPSQGPHDLDHR
jgi:acyl-CoA reductase-like NAD-dependent aldehyde dehydrogenase